MNWVEVVVDGDNRRADRDRVYSKIEPLLADYENVILFEKAVDEAHLGAHRAVAEFLRWDGNSGQRHTLVAAQITPRDAV